MAAEDWLIYDDYDDYDDEYGIVCKRCGTTNLRWHYVGHWVLMDNNVIHQCPPASADEFETVQEKMKKPKQPEHSLFAFSASPRWIPCPGSMAYDANTAQGGDGGFYANEGSALHLVASWCLKRKTVAEDYIGEKITIGKDTIEIDAERAEVAQTYVDDVLMRSLGGYLMVEQRLTLEGVEGFDASNYGTGDAVIGIPARFSDPAYGVIEDLKGGAGEKVYCWEYAKSDSPFTMTHYVDDEAVEVVPNYQLMMYALAARKDLELLIDELAFMRIVICQPRLNSIQELDVPVAVLDRFALFAADALKRATYAMGIGVKSVEAAFAVGGQLLTPGDKQCRWCRAVAHCPAAAKRVVQEVGAEFDVIPSHPPVVSVHPSMIAKAMVAIPFIKDWCTAVQVKANEMVAAGAELIGPDSKPYKFVEGDLGDRKWKDPAVAEAALLGVLGPEEAYQPKKILTAPAAAKKLDKKKTKQLWIDQFAPLIDRAPGKPVLALGSDQRPAYSTAAESDEFEDVTSED